MSTHVFSEIYLHVNWHCINDKPMITKDIEVPLYKNLEECCKKTKGIHLDALGGTETHIHMAFQMEPFVLLSEFLGQIKGSSAFELNKQIGKKVLKWQRGYGVVSFSKKHLSWVSDYIANQKEHHAKKTFQEVLEKFESDAEEDIPEAYAEAVEKPR